MEHRVKANRSVRKFIVVRKLLFAILLKIDALKSLANADSPNQSRIIDTSKTELNDCE